MRELKESVEMPLSINALMRHLRNTANISIAGSRQKQLLRSMGYYHGYKGYPFMGTATNRIPFSDFDQVAALYEFDMRMKTLIYPEVMFIETALKSYVLEAVLEDAGSEDFNVIFSRSMTAYREVAGTKRYGDELRMRLRARDEINRILYNNCDSKRGDPVIWHFLEPGKPVPIWAIFEELTLGQFGSFYLALGSRVKNAVAHQLDLPRSVDGGKVVGDMIFMLRLLRNAVAHNKPIYDCRFRSRKPGGALIACLQTGTGINGITFDQITDFVILMAYLLRKMGKSKTECRRFANGYLKLVSEYWKTLPGNTAARIAGTDVTKKINAMIGSM